MSLRNLYRPVQPTVRPSDQHVSYRECPPDLSLQNIIYCYWQLKTNSPLLNPFHYRVVADGCIDIFFDLTNPSESFVMGFCKKYTEFPLKNNFNYTGIRFLPSMFPQLFKVSAFELTDSYEKLELISQSLAHVIKSELSDFAGFEAAVHRLNQYFIHLLQNITFDPDPRFYNALNIIVKNSGTVETESALNTGISARQLRRIFNHYIGTTPKTFSKVVRFQHILQARPSVKGLKQDKLFYDLGFYDQAHFIKDFKSFYGITPAKAFR